jgi:transcription elongation factor S-II
MFKKVFLDVMTAFYQTEAGKADAAAMGGMESQPVMQAHCERVGAEVEAALFLALGAGDSDKPAAAYGEQFKVVYFGLKENTPLTVNVYWGAMLVDNLATATSEDLMSADARKRVADIRQAAAESTQLDWVQKNKAKVLASAGLKMGEGTLACIKCKSKNTEYTQKQTRSADEPMTT